MSTSPLLPPEQLAPTLLEASAVAIDLREMASETADEFGHDHPLVVQLFAHAAEAKAVVDRCRAGTATLDDKTSVLRHFGAAMKIVTDIAKAEGLGDEPGLDAFATLGEMLSGLGR